jgi:hypothetical protein
VPSVNQVLARPGEQDGHHPNISPVAADTGLALINLCYLIDFGKKMTAWAPQFFGALLVGALLLVGSAVFLTQRPVWMNGEVGPAYSPFELFVMPALQAWHGAYNFEEARRAQMRYEDRGLTPE